MPASVNSVVVNDTAADPLSINPSATANDVIITGVFARTTGATVTSWPASFDQIGLQNGMNEAGGTLAVARKKVATGAEGSLSINLTAAIIGFMLSLSGADNVNTEDVTSVSVVDTTSTASPWTLSASITPVTNECLIVAITGDDADADGNAVHSFATTSGTTGAWTIRTDQFAATGFNLSVATALQTTAGAITVQATGTIGGNSGQSALILMAIRPGTVSVPRTRSRLNQTFQHTLNDLGQDLKSQVNIRCWW